MNYQLYCDRFISNLEALVLRNNDICNPASKTKNRFSKVRGARLILNIEVAFLSTPRSSDFSLLLSHNATSTTHVLPQSCW